MDSGLLCEALQCQWRCVRAHVLTCSRCAHAALTPAFWVTRVSLEMVNFIRKTVSNTAQIIAVHYQGVPNREVSAFTAGGAELSNHQKPTKE